MRPEGFATDTWQLQETKWPPSLIPQRHSKTVWQYGLVFVWNCGAKLLLIEIVIFKTWKPIGLRNGTCKASLRFKSLTWQQQCAGKSHIIWLLKGQLSQCLASDPPDGYPPNDPTGSAARAAPQWGPQKPNLEQKPKPHVAKFKEWENVRDTCMVLTWYKLLFTWQPKKHPTGPIDPKRLRETGELCGTSIGAQVLALHRESVSEWTRRTPRFSTDTVWLLRIPYTKYPPTPLAAGGACQRRNYQQQVSIQKNRYAVQTVARRCFRALAVER